MGGGGSVSVRDDKEKVGEGDGFEMLTDGRVGVNDALSVEVTIPEWVGVLLGDRVSVGLRLSVTVEVTAADSVRVCVGL